MGILALGALILWLATPSEPAFKGKRLSQWMADLDAGQPESSRELARQVLRQFGTNALTGIFNDLSTPEPTGLKDKWHRFTARHRWVRHTATTARRQRGIDAFQQLSREHQELALPQVEQLFDQPAFAFPAIHALWNTGPKALPLLIRGLRHPQDRVRWMSGVVLARMGPEARPAAPALIKVLEEDSEPSVLHAATDALEKIDPKSDLAVAALIKILDRSDSQLQTHAALNLARFGKRAGPAIARLRTMLLEQNDGVAADVPARTLGAIGEAAIPVLLEALSHPDFQVCACAMDALANMGPQASHAVPAILQRLNHKEGHVRFVAAKSLASFPEASDATVPELMRALQDPEEIVRQQVVQTLGKLGRRSSAAWPALLEARRDQARFNSNEVLKALQAIDPEAAADLEGR
jgi:HEAT repeat protein